MPQWQMNYTSCPMYRVSIPTSLGPLPAHDMCVRSVIGLGASGDSVWCPTATSAHVSSMVEQSSLEDSIRF